MQLAVMTAPMIVAAADEMPIIPDKLSGDSWPAALLLPTLVWALTAGVSVAEGVAVGVATPTIRSIATVAQPKKSRVDVSTASTPCTFDKKAGARMRDCIAATTDGDVHPTVKLAQYDVTRARAPFRRRDTAARRPSGISMLTD